MADNIKIIGNINDIQRISRIKDEDQNLLNTQIINQTFGYNKDYIEFFIYDLNQNLIYSNLDYKKIQNYIGDIYTTSYLFVEERINSLLDWIKKQVNLNCLI